MVFRQAIRLRVAISAIWLSRSVGFSTALGLWTAFLEGGILASIVEPSGRQIRCWFSIISSLCQKVREQTLDLIQKNWKRCRIAGIILGEIGASDLTTDKIKAEVEFVPRVPFALCFMLLLKPLYDPAGECTACCREGAPAKDLQSGAIDNQMDWA